MIALPETTLTFKASDIVVDKSVYVSGLGYCGKVEYNVTLQDGTALNSSIFTYGWDPSQLDQEIKIQTSDSSRSEQNINV